MGGPLEAGERVILLDSRGRRYLVRLQEGGTFHYHAGMVPHDLVIGSEEGAVVHSTTGASLVCVRPRLVDFILKMPRGAQVVYPKDLGAILTYADVAPGARVLEAGSGSGALTMALARAVGPHGALVSYEIRDDHLARARDNLEMFFGSIPRWVELRSGDVRDVASTGERYDRLVLDLPEPWGVLEAAEVVLPVGGILAAYLPTTGQVQELVAALHARGYGQIETFEILHRTWHVTPRSVRPDHRMVAHTGFVTVARSGLGGSEPNLDGEPTEA